MTDESPPPDSMDETYINYLLAKIVVLTHERDALVKWSKNALDMIDPDEFLPACDRLRKIIEKVES